MSRKLDFLCKYCKKNVKKTADYDAGMRAKEKHENSCNRNPKFKNK